VTSTRRGGGWVVVEAAVSLKLDPGTVAVPAALRPPLRTSGHAEVVQGPADPATGVFAPTSATARVRLVPAQNPGGRAVLLASDVATQLSLPGGSQVGLHVAVRLTRGTDRRVAQATLGGVVTAAAVTVVNQAALAHPNDAVTVAGAVATVVAGVLAYRWGD
jgi:hypothetical protein